jgi:hypothetical protein
MKLFKTLGLLSALAFAVSAPAAPVGNGMRVHVPFTFVLAGQEFAPGDYMVSQTESGVVLVRGSDRGAFALSYPASAPPDANPGLRFTKSGEKEYLVGVQNQDLTRSIPIHVSDQRKLTFKSQ